MTDNEIIKALNYCCGNIENNDEECNEDMCYQVTLPESRDEGIRWCRQWLMKDALDLINRQKAEIEKIKKKLQYYLNINEENGVVYIPKFVVDNLVKEMTEENENGRNVLK